MNWEIEILALRNIKQNLAILFQNESLTENDTLMFMDKVERRVKQRKTENGDVAHDEEV